jgi:hypothetical protein
MKKVLLMIAMLGVAALASSMASADCIYGDYEYPTGTVIGGKTCQADGKWK